MLKYNYNVVWSEDEQEYMGLCDRYPSLSYFAESASKALTGILELVEEESEKQSFVYVIVGFDINSAQAIHPAAFKTREAAEKYIRDNCASDKPMGIVMAPYYS